MNHAVEIQIEAGKACYKCGHTPGVVPLGTHYIEYVPGRPPDSSFRGGRDDCLKITCSQCGYSWRVETLDQRKKKAKEEKDFAQCG